jgi:hypothetical protein
LTNPIQQPRGSVATDTKRASLTASIVFERSTNRSAAHSSDLPPVVQFSAGGDLDDDFADFEAEVIARASVHEAKNEDVELVSL